MNDTESYSSREASDDESQETSGSLQQERKNAKYAVRSFVCAIVPLAILAIVVLLSLTQLQYKMVVALDGGYIAFLMVLTYIIVFVACVTAIVTGVISLVKLEEKKALAIVAVILGTLEFPPAIQLMAFAIQIIKNSFAS